MSCSSPPRRMPSSESPVESHARRRGHGVLADPDRVAAGVGVLGLERPGQHLHALEEQLLDPLRLLPHLPLEVLLVVAVLQHERPLLERAGHPRLQLAHRDRLEQEVRGAAVQAVHRGAGLAHAAQHDDRGVGVAVAHLLEEADAVHLRHAHVGDDEGRLADAVEDASASRPRARLEALEPLRLEHADEEPADAGLVVHDEALGGAGHDRLRVLACLAWFTVYLRWAMDATNIQCAYTVQRSAGEMSTAPATPLPRRGVWRVLSPRPRGPSRTWSAGARPARRERCQACRRVCDPSTSGSIPSSVRPSGTRWRRSSPASTQRMVNMAGERLARLSTPRGFVILAPSISSSGRQGGRGRGGADTEAIA